MEEESLQELLNFIETIDHSLLKENSLDSVNNVKQDYDIRSPAPKRSKTLGIAYTRGSVRNCNLTSSPSKLAFDELNVSSSQELNEDVVINEFLKIKEIPNLYPWQKKCLEIVQNKNCVLSIPTSGGKTLVGEILIVKEIRLKEKSAIFILPYISLVHEKYQSLAKAAEELDFFLEEYAGVKGQYPPTKRQKNKKSIYICTIEKASKLVGSLIQENRIDEIGLIVIDEFHMLNEPSRGPILECVVSKVLYLKPNIQIFTMSATIGNIHALSTFIQGMTYIENSRPTKHSEYINIGNRIFQSFDGRTVKEIFADNLSESSSEIFRACVSTKSEAILNLVRGNVMLLIFCPSKMTCNNLAVRLQFERFPGTKEYKKQEKEDLIEALREENEGKLCANLEACIRYGVAYHHADLTLGERRLIEEAYLASTLQILCCTSTLAAGVNLPAQRVIIRDPYVGREFISLNMYKQMVGRAGRTGLQESGESIVLCKTMYDFTRFTAMMNEGPEPITSHMDPPTIVDLILEVVAANLCSKLEDLKLLVKHTLFYQLKNKEDQQEFLETTLPTLVNSLLASKGTMLTQDTDGILKLTSVATAAVAAGLSHDISLIVYSDLVQNKASFCLLNSLHMLFLVIPLEYRIPSDGILLARNKVYDRYSKFHPQTLAVAESLGVTENLVALNVTGKLKEEKKALLCRFFHACVLYDILNLDNHARVVKLYGIQNSHLQQFLNSTSYFASKVYRFCEELPELWCYKQLLTDLPQTLMYCRAPSLRALLDLPGVKIGRARQLLAAGYSSLELIARADAMEMVSKIRHLPLRTARGLISAAKLHFITEMDKVESMKALIQSLEKNYEGIVKNK
uniref:Helicase POLQ-like n=1 Tax=Cacopsylla melanoneura TaxID=428564 RepID=A0A8D8QJ55_9HEMI